MQSNLLLHKFPSTSIFIAIIFVLHIFLYISIFIYHHLTLHPFTIPRIIISISAFLSFIHIPIYFHTYISFLYISPLHHPLPLLPRYIHLLFRSGCSLVIALPRSPHLLSPLTSYPRSPLHHPPPCLLSLSLSLPDTR